MVLPANERIDLHVHPDLKTLILERAEVAGQSLNEAATELFCKALGVDMVSYRIPRKTPGRKAGKPPAPARKRSKK